MRDRISSNRLLFELGRLGVTDYGNAQALMRKAILEGIHKFAARAVNYAIAYNPADAGPECWELWQE